MDNTKPVYGNWVSDKRIRTTFMAFAAFAVPAAASFALMPAWGRLMLIPGILLSFMAALMLAAGIYFVITQKMFSPEGGDLQNKVTRLLVDKIYWDGQGNALDIGCGSGALSILLAKKYENAHITGADYWCGSWEYSMEKCKANAEIEGLGSRTEFIRASASKLPFEDETFDLAVSNLVFHEVKDVSDKRECLKEALRVVKKGGVFVFQDLFELKPYFGTTDELMSLIKSWGIHEVGYESNGDAPFIPKALKLPFMLGTVGIIWGVK